jgi:monofunctional biosynthetic peptidoglycan transglycosylase
MEPLRKYLKLAGLWIWRLFLAYAIVFTVAASIALVLLYRAAYAPVAKVKTLQTQNPKQSVFMAEARRALKEAGRPDTLSQALVPLDSVSPFLVDAVISAEDDDFWVHPGFDLLSILKAYEFNAASGRFIRGASTITQQLAKNFFLNNEKTYDRKVRELMYTLLMERYLGKKRILELYLNYAQWSPNVFGCEAASKIYYGKPAARLTPHEAVCLAAVLARPNKLNPYMTKSGYMQKRKDMIIQNLYRRHKKTFWAGGFPIPEWAAEANGDSLGVPTPPLVHE